MVLSRDILYQAISIASWFDFFSVYDTHIIPSKVSNFYKKIHNLLMES